VIHIKRILHPTDFSELSLVALRYAVSFAETFESDLYIIHVVDEAYQYWTMMGPETTPVGPPPDELLKLSESELAKFTANHLAEFKRPITREVALGRPYHEIIRYAGENKIDLVVLGTHGRGGLRHALLGSVAERVVRKAPCPVLTIRDPSANSSKTPGGLVASGTFP